MDNDAGKPWLVLAGRSNTGKSSLCRLLAPWEKKRIRVGKTPGVTRTFTRFETDTFTIVDMPGFGYMKNTSKKDEKRIQGEIVSFIERDHANIFLAIHVINLPLFRTIHEKHVDTSVPFDKELYDFLRSFSVPVLVVANKADKLTAMQQQAELAFLRDALEMQQDRDVLLLSTKTKLGFAGLEARIDEQLATTARP